MFYDDWDPDRMMNGSTYGGMYGGGVVMLLVMVLLIALVSLAVYLAVRMASHHAPPARRVEPGATTAIDVLDQRLARGEITPDEYRETRPLLGA